MEVLDEKNRSLWITASYKKEDALLISVLERLGKQLKQGRKIPVFFGLLYIKDGKLMLYPVDFIEERGETL